MLLTHLVVVVVAVVVVMSHSLHRSCYSRYLCYVTFIHYHKYIISIILYLYYIQTDCIYSYPSWLCVTDTGEEGPGSSSRHHRPPVACTRISISGPSTPVASTAQYLHPSQYRGCLIQDVIFKHVIIFALQKHTLLYLAFLLLLSTLLSTSIVQAPVLYILTTT